MRILIISQYYPPDIGGAHRRSFNAVKGLLQNGHTIELLTAVPHYPLGDVPIQYRHRPIFIEESNNLRIIRVWMPPIAHRGFLRRLLLYVFFAFASFLALPIIKSPDIIWADSPSVFSSIPATFFSVLKRVPIVRNVDDLWPETAFQLGYLSNTQKKIGEFSACISYTLCNALTPISRAYCSVLEKKYHVPKSRLHVAEVGIDLSDYPIEKMHYKRTDRKFRIVYSGILGFGYDFEIILKTAKILQDSPVHFLIRGIGELEKEIRAQIKKNNLANVELSTEFLRRDLLIDLLMQSDALILPMKSNDFSDFGLPTKLLEYMACGRPIICCSSGESARIVDEAKCGIVLPPNDARTLATSIRELRNRTDLNELGANGRRYAEQHFSIERIAAKLEAAFQQAISN